MSTQKTNSESDLVKADRLQAAIVALEQQVQQIRATGEIAPPACQLEAGVERRGRGLFALSSVSLYLGC